LAIHTFRIIRPSPRSTRGVPQLGERLAGEVFVVAAQQVADLVFGVAGAAAAATQLGGDAAADLGDGVVGQLHHVEVIDHDRRAG
jgi:hypothetical protein